MWMSVQESSEKRQRVVGETVPCHTVIISNFADARPEEILPDSAANFFLNQGRSVTNYVLVPDFGPEPIFL